MKPKTNLGTDFGIRLARKLDKSATNTSSKVYKPKLTMTQLTI